MSWHASAAPQRAAIICVAAVRLQGDRNKSEQLICTAMLNISHRRQAAR